MSGVANDYLFVKTLPPKKAGHKQQEIKQDTYGLFRETEKTDLYVLTVMKFFPYGTNGVQVDVIGMTKSRQPYGKTFLITAQKTGTVPQIMRCLLNPMVTPQLEGYAFTYNMMDVLKQINTITPIHVTVNTSLMDAQFLDLHMGTPKGYVMGDFGILGHNHIDISGSVFSLILGNSVLGKLYPYTTQMEKTRKDMVINKVKYKLSQRGKVVNAKILEREVMTPLKVELFEVPCNIESYL